MQTKRIQKAAPTRAALGRHQLHRRVLLKPVWFNVVLLVHTSWGQTNQGWWTEDFCYLSWTSSPSEATGQELPLTVRWDSPWLNSLLPWAALADLLVGLISYRSSAPKEPAFLFLLRTEKQAGECPHHDIAAASWGGEMLWTSWKEGIQAGFTGEGCRCPGEIQVLMFNLSIKIQRNFFSLDGDQVSPCDWHWTTLTREIIFVVLKALGCLVNYYFF